MREVRIPQAQLFRSVTAQVRVHGIADANEIFEDGAAGRRVQVERDAALAVIERLEEEAVALGLVGRHGAGDVAARTRIFDLDDVGAEFGELDRTERSGAELLDGEDAKVGERPHAFFARGRIHLIGHLRNTVGGGFGRSPRRDGFARRRIHYGAIVSRGSRPRL